MTVVQLGEYRRLLGRYGDRDVALDLATLSDRAATELAANAEWEQHCARILYDAQARELRRYGIEPTAILGVRP